MFAYANNHINFISNEILNRKDENFMIIDDLRKLPDEQVLEIVRARLSELKKNKLGTSAFRNDELDMTWSSVTDYLRDIGYKMIDQKSYEIARFQRKGEMIISKQEYERYMNTENINRELANSKQLLEEKIAKYESNATVSKSNEDILADYMDDEIELFYAKLPANIVSSWRKFCDRQIYSKRCTLELALLNLMDAEKNIQDIYDCLYKQKSTGETKTTAISINLSKKISEKWKDYCTDTVVFTASQLVAVALNKYMEKKG